MLKYFIILGLLGCILVNVQEVNKPVQVSHYIFESFIKGKVRVKSGIISEQLLKDFIKDYVKKRDVNFSNREDIITLVQQVEQYIVNV